MGTGPSNAWPTFTDGPDGTGIGASDMNRMAGDFKVLSQQPAGRFLRYDTAMTGDQQWYNCRYMTAQYDVDAQGGYLSPDLHTGAAVADTFTINTTGLYHIQATERGSCGTSGYLRLGIFINSGSELAEDIVNFLGLQVWVADVSTTHYLTAGQQIQIRHYAFTSQPITLYTGAPGPFLTITRVQNRDL